MSYKVTFQTLAIMNDGKAGNVVQSREVIYTDVAIEEIPTVIDKSLEKRKRKCEILTIENVPGICLFGSNIDPIFNTILKQHGMG